jgi:hypothetical protein
MMQPMDAKKIKLADKIVPIFTNGRLTPETRAGQGTTPYSIGYVDGPNGKTSAKSKTEWMTLIPTIHNADTLGIRPDCPTDQPPKGPLRSRPLRARRRSRTSRRSASWMRQ